MSSSLVLNHAARGPRPQEHHVCSPRARCQRAAAAPRSAGLLRHKELPREENQLWASANQGKGLKILIEFLAVPAWVQVAEPVVPSWAPGRSSPRHGWGSSPSPDPPSATWKQAPCAASAFDPSPAMARSLWGSSQILLRGCKCSLARFFSPKSFGLFQASLNEGLCYAQRGFWVSFIK